MKNNLKSGRTIIAERDKLETASERMNARKKAKHKRLFSLFVVSSILLIAVFAGVIAFRQLKKQYEPTENNATVVATPTVEIIDENGKNQITNRIKSYVVNLEQDFGALGYRITRITLPTGKSREIYIDLAGRPYYFKTTTNRNSAVVAEDADRMIRYLEGKGITPAEYVDVRIDEKAYYK